MRFRTEHFSAGDIDRMVVQPQQEWGAQNITPEGQERLSQQEHSYTAYDGDEVIACFGIVPYWSGRGYGWTFISANIGSRIRYVTRICREIFASCGIRRIEASVNVGFKEGHRWMKLLGMTKECDCAKAFSPDGGDCALYARVT